MQFVKIWKELELNFNKLSFVSQTHNSKLHNNMTHIYVPRLNDIKRMSTHKTMTSHYVHTKNYVILIVNTQNGDTALSNDRS